MECVEDHVLDDKEGSDIKEEVDDGHEFDDEEREAPVLRKSLSNLISNHHIHCSKNAARGIQEYEFSCSNSPAPVFFHVQPKRKQYHYYFPCINDPQPHQVIEEADDDEEHKAINALVPNTPPAPENSFNFRFDAFDFEIMKRLSPFSVRVSNYSSEDIDENEGGNWQVDEEAEEFIRRFYEQLRLQSRMQLRTAVPGVAVSGDICLLEDPTDHH